MSCSEVSMTPCSARGNYPNKGSAARLLPLWPVERWPQLAVWDRIRLFLEALGDADPRVSQSAAGALHHILFDVRGWAVGPPTPAQLESIQGHLRFRPEALDAKLAEQLRFMVRVASSPGGF